MDKFGIKLELEDGVSVITDDNCISSSSSLVQSESQLGHVIRAMQRRLDDFEAAERQRKEESERIPRKLYEPPEIQWPKLMKLSDVDKWISAIKMIASANRLPQDEWSVAALGALSCNLDLTSKFIARLGSREVAGMPFDDFAEILREMSSGGLHPLLRVADNFHNVYNRLINQSIDNKILSCGKLCHEWNTAMIGVRKTHPNLSAGEAISIIALLSNLNVKNNSEISNLLNSPFERTFNELAKEVRQFESNHHHKVTSTSTSSSSSSLNTTVKNTTVKNNNNNNVSDVNHYGLMSSEWTPRCWSCEGPHLKSECTHQTVKKDEKKKKKNRGRRRRGKGIKEIKEDPSAANSRNYKRC